VPLTPVIVTETAPVVTQVNVEVPPGAMDVGEAVNVIVGPVPVGTVTEAVAVAVPPEGPVAVAV
jgi:hypothetical protein